MIPARLGSQRVKNKNLKLLEISHLLNTLFTQQTSKIF